MVEVSGEIYNHPDELLNDLFEAREVLDQGSQRVIPQPSRWFHFEGTDIRILLRQHGHTPG